MPKDEGISALESVYGRKNPSAIQTKQLKRAIPNMSILKVLLANSVIMINFLTFKLFWNKTVI